MSENMFKAKIKEAIFELCKIQGYFQFKSENSEIAQKGIHMTQKIILMLDELLESGIL